MKNTHLFGVTFMYVHGMEPDIVSLCSVKAWLVLKAEEASVCCEGKEL